MKEDHPIVVNRARTQDPPGGDWTLLDPVARGRVQILPAGDNPISQAQEAVVEYVLETGGAETPVDSFIEWLAEWGREVRRRQRGLLLLTAHRAKGLEFDHVVVLDGGWDRASEGEDAAAPVLRGHDPRQTDPRVMRFPGRHRFQDALLNTSSALLQREPAALTPPAPELSRRYQRLSLRDVFLGFGGYRGRSIQCMPPSPRFRPATRFRRVWRRIVGSCWTRGTVVGQLARGFQAPSGVRCACATVMAIVEWDRERSDPDYRDGLRCESWEVVVPDSTDLLSMHIRPLNRLGRWKCPRMSAGGWPWATAVRLIS